MPQPKYSIEEMQAQIAQLTGTMMLPGVPDDEKAIYRATIQRIQAQIAAQRGPATQLPQKPTPEPIKHSAPPHAKPWPPSSQGMEEAIEREEAMINQHREPKPEATSPSIGGGRGEARDIITPRIIAPAAIPRDRRLDATIEADHNADPYNPVITIRWDDGYHFTGDETAIRGRFTSTLRDTIELKYSQERKFEKIWRWDTPWRCAGFYKALIHFNPEAPPTLADLGFTRPGDITRIVFDLVTAAAENHEISNAGKI